MGWLLLSFFFFPFSFLFLVWFPGCPLAFCLFLSYIRIFLIYFLSSSWFLSYSFIHSYYIYLVFLSYCSCFPTYPFVLSFLSLFSLLSLVPSFRLSFFFLPFLRSSFHSLAYFYVARTFNIFNAIFQLRLHSPSLLMYLINFFV